MNIKQWRTATAAAAAAVMVAVGINYLPSVSAAPKAAQQVSAGRSNLTCQVDASGYCTVAHGLGVRPNAIVLSVSAQSTSSPLTYSLDHDATTATTFRPRFMRSNGTLYAAGTSVRFNALFDVPGPVATTPPPSTPATTPPATTPPATTPTDPASPVKACDNPSFVTTSNDNQGDGRTFGAYFVHNNMWNNQSSSGPSGTYTLAACNFDNWYVDVTQQPSTVSPGAVRAYPNVHKDYNDVPLSQVKSADFAANGPRCAGCVYNIAFDVWIGNGFDNELMIWTDNWNQRPAGTRLADKVIGGKTYQVWKSGGATSPGGIFTYVSVPAQTFGTMPLDLFFADIKSRGWINGPETTWQVDYGVETVSTAGAKQRFNFTDFEIHE